MATNLQPVADGDTTNAIPGLVGVSFLFATVLISYAVRMWTRIRPTFKLTIIDYITSAALVSAYRCCVLCEMC